MVVIDTGSSTTWIGASTPYKPTKTSVDTGDTVVCLFAHSVLEVAHDDLTVCLLWFRKFLWRGIHGHGYSRPWLGHR